MKASPFVLASVLLTSCAAAWDSGDVAHWPESPGEIAIYARPAVNNFVQIDRLTVSVDDGPAREMPPNGEAIALHLTSGPHRVEVVGAFRRCLLERCNGAWTFWRRAEIRIALRPTCSAAVRVDIFDESRPLGWEPEAPMMDLQQRTRCDARDPEVRVSRGATVIPADASAAVGIDATQPEPLIEIGAPSTAPASSAP